MLLFKYNYRVCTSLEYSGAKVFDHNSGAAMINYKLGKFFVRLLWLIVLY